MCTVRLSRIRIRADRAELAGLHYEPVEDRGLTLVLAHGYTGSKETLDILCMYLCSRGWRCVSFDFRGHKLGGSTGEMNSAEDAVADLMAAGDFTREALGAERLALVGHSLGGAVALAVSQRREDVQAIVVMGTSASVQSGFQSPAGESLMQQRGDYVLGAPPATILSEAASLWHPDAGGAEKPALFVAGRSDIIVPPAGVQTLARRYGPQASFLIVEGGHTDLPVRARGHIAGWLEQLSAEAPRSRSA